MYCTISWPYQEISGGIIAVIPWVVAQKPCAVIWEKLSYW